MYINRGNEYFFSTWRGFICCVVRGLSGHFLTISRKEPTKLECFSIKHQIIGQNLELCLVIAANCGFAKYQSVNLVL